MKFRGDIKIVKEINNNLTRRIKSNTHKFNWMMMWIAISTLLIDLTISRLSFLLNGFDQWEKIIFISLTPVFMISLYFILRYTRMMLLNNPNLLKFRKINKVVLITQTLLMIIILLVIGQVYTGSQYSVILLTSAILVSYATSIYITFLLAKNFFSWLWVDKKIGIVLVFGLSVAILVITQILVLTYMTALMVNSPSTVGQQFKAYYPIATPTSAIGKIGSIYQYCYILSFMMLWISCALLLKNYWLKSKHQRYWFVVSLPLVFFLSQFVTFNLGIFDSLIKSNPTYYIIIFNFIYSLSLPIGGLLFAVSFWIIAKKLRHDSMIRKYINTAGYGILFICVSGQVAVTQLLYPPFGIYNMSFISTSFFMFFVGILSAAISASIDMKLLNLIQGSVEQKIYLFKNIADAQRKKDMFDTILKNTIREKNKINEGDGFDSSLSDEDLKNYLKDILEQAATHKSNIK